MMKSNTLKTACHGRFFCLLCLVFVAIPSLAVSANIKGPTEQLEPILTSVMSILADKQLAGDAMRDTRRSNIMTVVKQGFDFTEMSKRVLGKTWRELSDKDKFHFTELMTTLLENTYIGKLEGYSGGKVTYVAEKIQGEKAQVSTSVKNGNIDIPVHYILLLRGGTQWLVYDINIEGVSLIRNYKEQFSSILRTEQFSGLVKQLEEKNQSFSETK